jgi:hypothetical protein
VVFKGGTSLEKLGIIRRFSEDLDLLVIGKYPSSRAAERALKAMIDIAAAGTLGEATRAKSGGKPGSYHRSAYLTPPLSRSATADAIADATAILVELGQSGGPNPHEAQTVESLLSRQLRTAGFDTSIWNDLATFDVAVLHPGRTLIEKLLRINNFVADKQPQTGIHGWPRIGRQFYDIWALLGTPAVLDFLANKQFASEILANCYEVSLAFTPDKPIPAEGFAACAAFTTDSPLATRLRAEHDAAMRDLYYGTDEPPAFDAVIERVHSNRDLLDLGKRMT